LDENAKAHYMVQKLVIPVTCLIYRKIINSQKNSLPQNPIPHYNIGKKGFDENGVKSMPKI
jgi:hypothetical protein